MKYPAEAVIAVNVGHAEANEPYIAIADSGAGIPEADVPHIFDRFYRVDKGRSREIGGAGLGLAIACWAVAGNNGRIEVCSRVDEGSKFRVVFKPYR